MEILSVGQRGRVHMAHPASCEELFDFLVRARKPQIQEPLRRCLKVVADAQTVLFEDDYYDLDFRSEFSDVHAREFYVPTSRTTRLHFFRDRLSWQEILRSAKDCSERPDPTGGSRQAYLGYIVLRPTSEGIVGRTMLVPPDATDGIADFDDLVRTAVTEVVTLFGHQLRVSAVPFMQQDGSLLSCAHVVAWMAHMTAVLNKHAARTAVAAFARLTGTDSETRRYPTTGLTTQETVRLLEALGTPPITYTVHELMRRSESQADDMAVWLRPERRRWYKRADRLAALTSDVCRYLNSGLPVIGCVDEHQVLICGYKREVGTAKGRVTHFIVHNDQLGPYQLMKVPHRVEGSSDGRFAHSRSWLEKDPREPDPINPQNWHSIILPMPPSFHMTGLDAEKAAGDYALFAVRDLLPSFDQLLSQTRVARAAQTGPVLISTRDPLRAFARGIDAGQVSLRSYAMQGVAFKAKFAYRCSEQGGAVDPDLRLVDLVRQLPLPRFVWIVEFMDRPARDGGRANRPAVLGEAIISASGNPQSPRFLMIHVPGFVLVPAGKGWTGDWIASEAEPDDGEAEPGDSEIVRVRASMRYHTGRPSLRFDSPAHIYGQSKTMGSS